MNTSASSENVLETVFVSLDIETTGLSAQTDAIIEIGAVRGKLQGKEYDEFSKIVNPGAGVVNKAEHINNISAQMIAGGEPLVPVLQGLLEFIGDAVVVGHNILGFDLSFIQTALSRNSLPLIDNRIVDTVRLARRNYPSRQSNKLESLVADFNIPTRPNHRALDDSIACLKVLERIVMDKSILGAPPGLQEFLQ